MLDKKKYGRRNKKKIQSHLLFVLKRKNEVLLPQKTRRFILLRLFLFFTPLQHFRNFGHFCKEWGKITVMKIMLEFSWNFSVSLYWKRKKYNVPIPLSPYSDTSVYPLHTWIVLLNLTVCFKAIEANCSKQSAYFLRLIFFACEGKMLCSWCISLLWTWYIFDQSVCLN